MSVATDIHWTEGGVACSALWRSERGAAPPKSIVIADDTMAADAAYRLACAGTAMLWRGDFQNARQLLQAMARRIEKPPKRKSRAHAIAQAQEGTPAERFHRHRQAQAQRARILAMVLIPFDADYKVPLRRAPDARQACAEAWGPAAPDERASAASLRDLLGMTSAHEWRRKGVEVPSLGAAPNNRIYPHYGVFSPVRGEYIALVAAAPMPATGQEPLVVFDIGIGSGVLSAVMAYRGVSKVIGTDQDPRALACATANLQQLGMAAAVTVVQADLFPAGLASIVICNPPWLPARPSAPIERAVYDEDSRMLRGFLSGLAAHLAPGGEGWLILSDLAEHLGLRTREELMAAITSSGLQVAGRMDAKPLHPKTTDAGDPLHEGPAQRK